MTNRLDALGTLMTLVSSAASSDSFLSNPLLGSLGWTAHQNCSQTRLAWARSLIHPFLVKQLHFQWYLRTFHGVPLFLQFKVSLRFRQSRATGEGPRSRRVCPSLPLRPVANFGPVQTGRGLSPPVFQQCSSYPPRHCTLSGELLAAA